MTRRTASSVTVLIGQIRAYIQHWNSNPKPFVRTATTDEISVTAGGRAS